MGQTVRNQGPYDRLWMPGVPHNRTEQPERSKIEYLDERRKAKAAKASGQQDALQYDSNFKKAAAVHGERNPRQHYLKETPQPVRSRPQGVGGRQQMTDARQGAGVRGQTAPGAQGRGVPVRGQAGSAQQQRRGTQTPGTTGQVRQQRPQGQAAAQQRRPQGQAAAQQRRPQGQAAAQQRRPQGQAAVQQKKARGQNGKPAQLSTQSRGMAPAAPQRKPQSPGKAPVQQQKRPQTTSAAAKKNRQRPAAPRSSGRPKRDTVTDFHSIDPQQARPAPKPQTAAQKKQTKGNPGHGRKLTPKYELKTKKGARQKRPGAPIMEGGVVGFDMGTYGREPSASDPVSRPVKASSVVTTILTIAICFVLFTAVLAGQARLANYTQQNAKIENSIEEMEEKISKLKMQIALEEDLGNIQERAAALGLASPDDSQIRYVNLDETDEVKTVPSLTLIGQDTTAEPNGLLESVVAWFGTMLQSGSQPATVSSGEGVQASDG